MVSNRSTAGIISILVVTTLVLGGCVSGDTDDDRPDVSLYTGVIPEPLPLPVLGDLPALPPVPSDPSDPQAGAEYQDALVKYQAAMLEHSKESAAHADAVRDLVDVTGKGGAPSLAAWQSLLVTAGVAVVGADGELVDVNGRTGFGWALSDAELRLHSALATAAGGMRLVDLAEALEAIPQFAEGDVATGLHDALINNADQGFNSVFRALQPNTLTLGTRMRPAGDIVLNWAQVSLVLRRLAAELATWDSDHAAPAGIRHQPLSADATVQLAVAVDPAAATSAVNAAPANRPCAAKINNPWVAELLNQATKAHAEFVFDGVIEHLDDGLSTSIGTNLTIARTLAAFGVMIAKAAALKAKFSLQNPPLVRTHDTQPGQLRQLTVTYRFDADSWEAIRGCINLFMAPFGLEVPGSQPGAASGIDIDLSSEDPSVLRVGDGEGDTVVVNRGRTDPKGMSVFTLSGAPQASRIPEYAQPEDLVVNVRAVSNLGGNDFYKDIASLPWDAIDVTDSLGLGLIPQILSRTRFVTHTEPIPVRDWRLEADFEATLVGGFTARYAENALYTGCGVSSPMNRSEEVTASVASDAVKISAVLLSNPDSNIGDNAVVFVPTGKDFRATDWGDGVQMFDMPVNYRGTKSFSQPGTGTMPPQFTHPPSQTCGSGEGGEPPVPACGERDYAGVARVTMPAPRTLYAADNVWIDPPPWRTCGGFTPVQAPPAAVCESASPTGGRLPSIDKVFDPEEKVLEITGSLKCSDERKGTRKTVDYEWTLVLCRIIDGKSSC
jgi:hypothetical protein